MICYSQKDSRWANYPYPYNNGGQTIQSGGCGICSAATVVSSLSNSIVEPPAMAEYALANGYRVAEGTDHDLFFALEGKYGLTCERGSIDKEAVECVNNGYMAIVTAGSKKDKLFTTGGHIFVLVGYDAKNKKFKFFDPDTRSDKYTLNAARRKYAKREVETIDGVSIPFVYVDHEATVREITNCYCMTGPKRATEPSVPPAPPAQPPFADVPVTDYAWKHISALKDAGVINGDDQGNFRPDDAVSRRDVAIMVGNCLHATGVIDLSKYKV